MGRFAELTDAAAFAKENFAMFSDCIEYLGFDENHFCFKVNMHSDFSAGKTETGNLVATVVDFGLRMIAYYIAGSTCIANESITFLNPVQGNTILLVAEKLNSTLSGIAYTFRIEAKDEDDKGIAVATASLFTE